MREQFYYRAGSLHFLFLAHGMPLVCWASPQSFFSRRACKVIMLNPDRIIPLCGCPGMQCFQSKKITIKISSRPDSIAFKFWILLKTHSQMTASCWDLLLILNNISNKHSALSLDVARTGMRFCLRLQTLLQRVQTYLLWVNCGCYQVRQTTIPTVTLCATNKKRSF